MRVIYYNYYRFYKEILKDNEPHMLTIMALGASEGSLLVGLSQFFLSHYCVVLETTYSIVLFLSSLVLNIIVYKSKAKRESIIKEKPMFFSNDNYSKLITVLFFIATVGWMFWGAVLSENILSGC